MPLALFCHWLFGRLKAAVWETQPGLYQGRRAKLRLLLHSVCRQHRIMSAYFASGTVIHACADCTRAEGRELRWMLHGFPVELGSEPPAVATPRPEALL